MAQYINRSALVAEIEKRIKEIDEIGTYLSPKGVLTNLLCHLDTLEVKEVDLEKEIEHKIQELTYSSNYTKKYFRETARHFYELGLKAQKGE